MNEHKRVNSSVLIGNATYKDPDKSGTKGRCAPQRLPYPAHACLPTSASGPDAHTCLPASASGPDPHAWSHKCASSRSKSPSSAHPHPHLPHLGNVPVAWEAVHVEDFQITAILRVHRPFDYQPWCRAEPDLADNAKKFVSAALTSGWGPAIPTGVASLERNGKGGAWRRRNNMYWM